MDNKYTIYGNRPEYDNQEHPSLPGERMSTNGHYTGEHLGSPTQDKLGESTTNVNAHWVEQKIVRYGTMTPDAIEGSNPEILEMYTPEMQTGEE